MPIHLGRNGRLGTRVKNQLRRLLFPLSALVGVASPCIVDTYGVPLLGFALLTTVAAVVLSQLFRPAVAISYLAGTAAVMSFWAGTALYDYQTEQVSLAPGCERLGRPADPICFDPDYRLYRRGMSKVRPYSISYPKFVELFIEHLGPLPGSYEGPYVERDTAIRLLAQYGVPLDAEDFDDEDRASVCGFWKLFGIKPYAQDEQIRMVQHSVPPSQCDEEVVFRDIIAVYQHEKMLITGITGFPGAVVGLIETENRRLVDMFHLGREQL